MRFGSRCRSVMGEGRVPRGLTLITEVAIDSGLIYRVAWSPCGSTLAMGTERASICLLAAPGDRDVRRLVGHRGHVHAIAWHPTDPLVLSGSDDGTVRLWCSESGAVLAETRVSRSHVYAVAFSPDGESIAAASRDEAVRVWSTNSQLPYQVFRRHRAAVNAVIWSTDGRLIASGSDDMKVLVWEAHSGRVRGQLDAAAGWVSSLLWTGGDDGCLLSGHRDARIREWATAEQSMVGEHRCHAEAITSLSLNSDRRIVASKSDDSTVRLWDVSDFDLLGILDEPGPEGEYFPSIAFHPRTNILATLGSNGTSVRIWECDTEQLLNFARRIVQRRSAHRSEDEVTADKLKQRLLACRPGRADWRTFETLCVEILKFIFTDLGPIHEQVRSEGGMEITDAAFKNPLNHRFWKEVHRQFDCEHVSVEFKNEKRPIGPDAFAQIAVRLDNPSMGRFGMVIGRKPLSANCRKKCCRALSRIHGRKLILVLDDTMLIQMIDSRARGEYPEKVLTELKTRLEIGS